MKRLLFILLLVAGGLWYLASSEESGEDSEGDFLDTDVDDFPDRDYAGASDA